MTKGGIPGRYLYWSDRAVRRVAEDNGIQLQRRWLWTLDLMPVKWLQVHVSSPERATRDRLQEARRVEAALGATAVTDFDTPPQAGFVKGVGRVSFAEFSGSGLREVIMHVQTHSPRGRRMDICLFGSKDNLHNFEAHDNFRDGWTSSAWAAIEELLESKGTRNTSQWDDEQLRAVEVLKVALRQGETPAGAEHAGRPETRGFTMGHAGECEFVAEVYTDVLLDPQRGWNLDGEMVGAERIVVGRPLWIRTLSPEAVVLYARLRGPGARRRGLRRRRGPAPAGAISPQGPSAG